MNTNINGTSAIKAPWLSSYGELPKNLDYPDITIFELIERSAEATPDLLAYEFMGKEATFRQFMQEIDLVARSFLAAGISEGDKVTVCLPNTPQGITVFYALNKMGAIPNMIHPLSSEGEIEFYLNVSESVAAITLDAFYGKFAAVRDKTPIKKMIITSIKDALPFVKGIAFALTKGRKIKPIPVDADVIYWQDFLKNGLNYQGETRANKKSADPALILYSGGTTGTIKGIMLSNGNFNALAIQISTIADCLTPGNSILSILPIFHGFGLGVGIHTALSCSVKCILIPQFDVQTYGKLLKDKKPNYIAGVPTLFEALLASPTVKNVDLSFLLGVFCGGDTLSVELKKKVDAFLKEHNCPTQIREGYGMTESVTASCLTPKEFYKEGSIGIPAPDTYYKIVKPGTTEELPYAEDGEICVHSPLVMMGYINNQEENADTLQTHADGNVWLHTGDLGKMDDEGFIYFIQRLKRMIITSGYSVYPSQLENIIEAHHAVLSSCIIGVDDPYKKQKVKAFVVLQPQYQKAANLAEIKKDIYEHCKKNIAKYAFPYEFEYRDELPQTKVGKTAYIVLENEERIKQQLAKEETNTILEEVGVAVEQHV